MEAEGKGGKGLETRLDVSSGIGLRAVPGYDGGGGYNSGYGSGFYSGMGYTVKSRGYGIGNKGYGFLRNNYSSLIRNSPYSMEKQGYITDIFGMNDRMFKNMYDPKCPLCKTISSALKSYIMN
jgi:hypothetical protein